MTVVTVSPRYQVVIPEDVREKLKARPGQKVAAFAESMILATARAHDAVFRTQDADFEGFEKVRFKGKA